MPLIPKQEPPYYENTNGITIRQYIALLTQTGTSAPTATELKNTLGGATTIAYVSPGKYTITNTIGFPIEKTTIQLGAGSDPTPITNVIAYNSENNYPATSTEITIETYADYEATGSLANDKLYNKPIIITVYP